MPSLPGSVFPIPRYRAVDTTGAPIDGAKLWAWETGGTFTTPKSVYTTAALSVAHANPVVSNSAGLFAAIFLDVDGYDFQLKSNDGSVTYWEALDIQDVGQTFLAQLGSQMADGSFDVVSGYTVIAGDWMVTTAAVATSPFIVNLPALATWTEPITIKHQGSAQLRITPDGSDKIENIAAYYAVAAAATPNFPTVTLVPGSASWLISSSHGL